MECSVFRLLIKINNNNKKNILWGSRVQQGGGSAPRPWRWACSVLVAGLGRRLEKGVVLLMSWRSCWRCDCWFRYDCCQRTALRCSYFSNCYSKCRRPCFCCSLIAHACSCGVLSAIACVVSVVFVPLFVYFCLFYFSCKWSLTLSPINRNFPYFRLFLYDVRLTCL